MPTWIYEAPISTLWVSILAGTGAIMIGALRRHYKGDWATVILHALVGAASIAVVLIAIELVKNAPPKQLTSTNAATMVRDWLDKHKQTVTVTHLDHGYFEYSVIDKELPEAEVKITRTKETPDIIALSMSNELILQDVRAKLTDDQIFKIRMRIVQELSKLNINYTLPKDLGILTININILMPYLDEVGLGNAMNDVTSAHLLAMSTAALMLIDLKQSMTDMSDASQRTDPPAH